MTNKPLMGECETCNETKVLIADLRNRIEQFEANVKTYIEQHDRLAAKNAALRDELEKMKGQR